MFAFLKRRPFLGRSRRRVPAPSQVAPFDERLAWNDSAAELEKGAEVVEYDGEFAATVLLEHFAETTPATLR